MGRRVLGDLASTRIMTVDQTVSQSEGFDRSLPSKRKDRFLRIALQGRYWRRLGNGTLQQDLELGHLFLFNSAAGIPRGDLEQKGAR